MKGEAIKITSQQPAPLLLPWPQTLKPRDGELALTTGGFAVDYGKVRSERLDRAVARLEGALSSAGGVGLTPLRLTVAAASPRYPGIVEDESYRLEIESSGVELAAATEWGALRGLATLTQLVAGQRSVPCLRIDDAPRFPWRGLLLDPARRFLPASALERTLDAMALCKLNVLHLHLSDDQGFRLPSQAFPKLPSEQSYSAEELAGLVELAADRGIRIVPELDMPGHVTSWLTAYPEWGRRPVQAARRFGVHKACLDPTSDAVFEAIAVLLAEAAALFPDPCLHLGGDEVHPAWWSEDEQVQTFMAEQGLTTVRDLQAYFNSRVGALVEALGRQPLAWDEVAHPQLDSSWIVQAWRGATARDRLLAHGNRVVMSAPYYLDLHYPADVHLAFDPAAPQAELTAREDALLEDPRLLHVADGMRWTQQWRQGAVAGAVAGSNILGGEACLWGELVDEGVLDVRLWSRLPALAERFYAAAEMPAAATLQRRLADFQDRILPLSGIALEAQITAGLERLDIVAPWDELARLLEPVKWYGRLLGEEALAARLQGREMPQARPYDVTTALDGLADCLPPESTALRGLCPAGSEPDAAERQRLEGAVSRWRALAGRRDAPAALEPFRRRFGELAGLFKARLDGGSVPPGALEALERPQGELLLCLPPPLRAWLLSGP